MDSKEHSSPRPLACVNCKIRYQFGKLSPQNLTGNDVCVRFPGEKSNMIPCLYPLIPFPRGGIAIKDCREEGNMSPGVLLRPALQVLILQFSPRNASYSPHPFLDLASDGT